MRRSPLAVSLVALALFALGFFSAARLDRARAATQPVAAPATHAKERADAASKAQALYSVQYATGLATAELVYQWSRRAAEADALLGKTAAWTDHLTRMQKLEADAKPRVAGGLASAAETPAVAFYVAEAKAFAGVP